MTTTTDIRKADTVRLDGERYTYTVDTVRANGTLDIHRMWRTRSRDTRYIALTVAVGRLTLVRHGNRLDDQVDAFLAHHDAQKAYAAGDITEAELEAARDREERAYR